jgi:hypothetical protein
LVATEQPEIREQQERCRPLEPEEDAPWPLSEEAEENAKPGQTARAIDRALCPDAPCCVTELQEAGRDRKGQDLFVVALSGVVFLWLHYRTTT